MTSDDDVLTRELDLLWLRSELAALPRRGKRQDLMAPLRAAAHRAFLLAQAEDRTAPDHATLERLILLLAMDRLWRSGGRQVLEMDDMRFRAAKDSHAGRPDPFGVRFDITRPGALPDEQDSPAR